ncbi:MULTISPECIES: hypothetical protein [Pseudomonadaceae]|uniref:hypothetical protein n=1 Tax=Pseudomonadaceae TaxID=135621 RepID=UPI001112DF15|nr:MULTISPECIES: hypothetical protein [Pseudomonas]
MTKETEAQPTKTKSTTTRNILVALLATLCISSLGYWALQPPQPKDAFIEALDEAFRKNNRNITKLLNEYIKPGDDIDATIKALEARGFKVDRSESSQNKYYATKESIKKLIISTRTVITMETDGAKIKKVRGNIFLTSL